jgi:SHS2 domain-containing protein
MTACAELSIECGEEGYRLTARGTGGRWDPQRHPPGAPVKAATYHALAIRPAADGRYEVTVVFDT